MRSCLWVALVLVLACGGSKPAERPEGDGTDNEAASDLVEHHGHHHHGAVMMFIALSLDTLGVTAEQNVTINKIQADLYTKLEPARLANQNVLTTLADGVAASNVDRTKVEAAVAQLTSAASSTHDAVADALNQLHEALTPAQRTALVDKVEAHWEVWRHANSAKEGTDRGHGWRVAKQLALTSDQVEKVRAGFASATKDTAKLDADAVAAHLAAFRAGFASATFDAKALPNANSVNGHLAGWGATHLARFCEAASPVLTDEQRAKLVALLREHSKGQPTP
jgi:Spy/CpxP family protein refolding chaperone